ncbi:MULTISPECIES: CPBP family intramembrane glutamic endopeptidase [unclassified Microbacterium]|uniref:CPBP family intramembrane glutamic endopeptidase n=1 Tax=unclassified Microbacterium TaxID=2609290 RepID=UPI00301ADA73
MTHPAPLPPTPLPVPPRAAALPPDATSGGLAFHRLLFARRRRGWWTPLAVGALGVAFYTVILVAVIIVVIVASALGGDTVTQRLMEFGEDMVIDPSDPIMLTLLLGTVAVMLPCYLLASRIVNGPRLGLASSAAGRLRWGWMLRCGAAAAGLSIVLSAVSMLIPQDGGAPAAGPDPLWAVSLVLVLLLVPVQSAAEEYVFRGYLMQAIGRWLRHPAWAILLPVPLFVLGHMYDLMGQLGVGLFAVAAGWLTWRTGGLEAAIALHVVNNLSAFLLGIVTGANPVASSTDWVSFVWSFLLIGGYTALVEWLMRRRPLPRTLILTPPPAPVPLPPPVWPPAPAPAPAVG